MADDDIGAKLSEFIAQTGSDDVDVALQVLELSHWDVSQAVALYRSQHAAPTSRPVTDPFSDRHIPSHPQSSDTYDDDEDDDYHASHFAPGAASEEAERAPLRRGPNAPSSNAAVNARTSSSLSSSSSQNANAQSSPARTVLDFGVNAITTGVKYGMSALGKVVGAFTSAIGSSAPGGSDSGSVVGPQAFSQYFEREFGSTHPRFLALSSQQALRESRRTNRLLVVYLHSSDHPDASRFCREVLANPTFVQFLDANFLVWASSIRDADGYQVSNSLGAEGFPFLAVVSTSAEGIYLQARFVGFVPADRLLQGLSTITDDYASAQAAQSMANEERDQARRLREEQDAAYRAAEQADMQRRAQERAAAEERRKKEEEERRAAEARAKLSQSRQQRVAEWRERSAGYDASKSEYCMIRLRLPSGAVQGVFKQEDTMALVYDVARVEGQIDDATHFALCTNLPPAEISSNVLVKDASGGSRQLQLFFKEQ